MARNRYSLWQRITKPEWRPIQAAIEEIAQALSNLLSEDTASATPTSGCLATRTTGMTGISSTTLMIWDDIDFNPQDELDSSGVFTAAESGYYALAFYAYVGSVGSTNRSKGWFDHNGAQVGFSEQLGGRTVSLALPLYPLEAGDTIKVYVGHTGAGTLTGDPGYAGCFISIVKIGDL